MTNPTTAATDTTGWPIVDDVELDRRRALLAAEEAHRELEPFAPAVTVDDAWRMDEWNALPDVCLIAACDNDDLDRRGPVWLRDGSMHKACVEHWEGILRVLGQQASWERTDGARQAAQVKP